MTLEEIIKYCENVADYDCFSDAQRRCSEEHHKIAEWLKEIKENEPDVETEKCSEISKNSDSISRQATVAEIREWKSRLPVEGLVDHILALPPIKPELTPGKWIPKHSKYCRTWECSKCGYRVDLEDGGIYNFCAACGEKKG